MQFLKHDWSPFFAFLLVLMVNSGKADIPPAVNTVSDLYLRAHHDDMEDDDSDLIEPAEERYITWWGNNYSPSHSSHDIEPLTYHSRKVLVQILAEQMKSVTAPVRMNPDIWRDSRVLDQNDDKHVSVAETAFPGYTLTGEIIKTLMLAQPTSNPDEIRQQQFFIKKAMGIKSPDKLKPALKRLNDYEPGVAYLFDGNDAIYSPEIQALLNLYGNRSWLTKAFDFSTNLASKAALASMAAFYGAGMARTIAEPFRAPHYCSREFLFGTLYSVFSVSLFSAAGILTLQQQLLAEKNEMLFYRLIRIRTDAITHYLRHALAFLSNDAIPSEMQPELTQSETAALESFLNSSQWLMDQDPEASSNYLVYATELLWASRELKAPIARILFQSGRMDMYLAIANKMISGQHSSGHFTFAELVKGAPYIKAKGLWNPRVDARRVVTNDIALGAPDAAQRCLAFEAPDTFHPNVILTGCEASGKSTLMRAVTTNFFLSQVYGIAAADSFQTSLFHAAHSHMDKFDQVDEGSSFQNELKVVDSTLSVAGQLNQNENMFVCLDEIFSSTNPAQALNITNNALEKFARQPGLITMVSTHLDVEEWGDAYPDNFAMMHMEIEKINQTLVKTYKLREGYDTESSFMLDLMDTFRAVPDIFSELTRLYEELY